MKAVRYHEYGDSGVLVHEEVPRPAPGPGEVLVEVAGTSFNPVDAAIRGGHLREVFPIALPHVPGIDVAGTVVELGPDVPGWRVGDAVVAMVPAGAAAEYVVAPAGALAAAPKAIELADAAALPATAQTARQALFEDAGLTAGQTLLVNGGGGAVGGYAVQLAKRAGAVVTTTASPRSADRLRRYGADRIVDHTAAPVTEALAGERYDVVLSLVPTPPEETAALAALVADGGVLAGTSSPVEGDAARGVRAAQVFVRADGARLAELVALVDAGALDVHVAERVGLARLAEVHARGEAGTLSGKTVLTP